MLPEIDAGSLFVASAVIFGGLLLSVLLAWRELRTKKGPDRFAWSYALFSVGLILFALRGRVPDWASMAAANVLLVLGASFVLEGTKLLLGRPAGRRLTLWTLAVSTAAFSAYTFGREDADARTVLSSLFLGGLLGAAGWTSWRGSPRSGVQLLEKTTAIALTTCALLFLARAGAIGAGLAGGEMLEESPWMAVPPLLCTLCAVVWTTALLANTSRHLMGVVKSQNDLLANLLEVTRAAGSEARLDVTLEKVLRAVRSITGATGSSLLVLDEKGRFTNGMFTEGPVVLKVEREEGEVLLAHGLAGWVVRNGRAAVVPEVEKDARWYRSPTRKSTVRSALSAPISSGSLISGVLTLVHSSPAHFGDDHRQLIESTAAQIALALRTAQIADARLRGRQRQAMLNEVLEISARRDGSDEIATEASAAISRWAFWPRVFLALPGEDGHFRMFGRTAGLEELHPRIEEGPLGRALHSGVSLKADVSPHETKGTSPKGEPCRRLVVPLRHLGRTLGLACFDSPVDRADDVEDAALAEALAEAVSLGLGKAALARAREELTRMMVHDLRGPLSGVMGALELLRAAPCLDDEHRRLLDAAERNARRQLALIEGILELARLEEGAIPLLREELSLPGLVQEVLARALPAAEARGLSLIAEVPEDLPLVRGDPGLLARVLENLVGNAVKFSEPGAEPISVRARVDGPVLELRVRDSGPGVDDDLRPRLFEKFATGSLAARGTGLGLAFCRLAIEAQGGRIWLDHPGPGSTFAISLPLASPPSS